jgi:hypothetical protein
MIFMVVDFPDPFGPRKPVTRPGGTVKVRSSTTVSTRSVDVAPELLIGAAVDVIVQRRRAFVGRAVRRRRPLRPAAILAASSPSSSGCSSRPPSTWPCHLAQPGPDHPARGPDGRLRPRAGPRARLLRGPVHRRPDGGAQRRRQPARAVPRHGANEIIQVLTTSSSSAGRSSSLADHRPAGVPAHPGHPVGLDPLPAPPRAPLRAVREQAGPTSTASLPTTSAGSPRSRRSPPRTARSSASRPRATTTATPTATAIRLSSAFVPLIRMAILAGFTAPWCSAGSGRAATATSRSASTRCSSS